MTTETILGILIPFFGTSLGAAMVFVLKKNISDNLQKILTGFAAGVMVAASFWSLLQPALESSESTLIEVKASTGNTKSAKTILNHPEKYHVGQCIKLGDYNVGRNGRILTLPLYMGFLLNEV